MFRDIEEVDALSDAMQKTKIPQIIVGYLKLQQSKNQEFFDLFIDKKINGRLFYNTCLPNGAKEVRYGNEDFLQEAFKNVIDDMLAPFNNVSLQDVRSEFVMPTKLSDKMNFVITEMLSHIETTKEWKEFWEREINLHCGDAKKKDLYNQVASNVAYKALVSCIDHSKYILDPPAKRNVAVLIGICAGKYHSPFLQDSNEFHLKEMVPLKSTKQNVGEFGVFKSGETTDKVTRAKKKTRSKRKTKSRKVLAPAH